MQRYRFQRGGSFAVLCVLILIGTAVEAEAQRFRNISSITLENYFDNTYALKLENVFIGPLPPERLQFQFKAANQTDNLFGETRSLSMATAGPIVLFTPNVYGIATYGIGLRDTGEIVHEGDLQLHYESARFRFGGGARGRYEPEDDVSYVIPSIGGRVQLPRGFGLSASYYLGLNNDGDLSNAIWSEIDYAATPRLMLKLGGSVELGDDVAWPDGSDRSYSIISGIGFTATETLRLRYEVHYIGRADLDDGVRNFLFLDWRF